MPQADAAFSGSIPSLYEQFLVPILFRPYAIDLADRIAALKPSRVLETAAGTGAVTKELAARLPDTKIVATDLNQAMLDIAARELTSPNVTFQQANAINLPFESSSFDAVVCQFGAMFFPDRTAAYREALRVLTPGGTFLFNVWGPLETNAASAAVERALRQFWPPNEPSFLERVPFGYHDNRQIMADLRDAGFAGMTITTVALGGTITSAENAAIGLCQGTPLRAELEAKGPDLLERATEAATEEIARLIEREGPETRLMALVIQGQRP